MTGATGLIGSAILASLLSSPAVTRISVLSHRPVKAATGHAKANVIIHQDYASYPPSVLEQLKGAKACIWAQGKSQIGMLEPDYQKLTHDWPLAAAKSFEQVAKAEDQGNFNFVYISGEGADPTGTSRTMFARIKGITETDLLSLASQESSTLTVYNLRPAGIDNSESKARPDRPKSSLEILTDPLLKIVKRIAPRYITPVDWLAKVSIELAIGDSQPISAGEGVEAHGWTLRNTAIRRLGSLPSHF